MRLTFSDALFKMSIRVPPFLLPAIHWGNSSDFIVEFMLLFSSPYNGKMCRVHLEFTIEENIIWRMT
jgi:hypothetical protein